MTNQNDTIVVGEASLAEWAAAMSGDTSSHDAADRRNHLEHRLAVLFSAAAISTNCKWGMRDRLGWYDLSVVRNTNNLVGMRLVPEAAEYLALCGLLKHHATQPWLVRFSPEVARLSLTRKP